MGRQSARLSLLPGSPARGTHSVDGRTTRASQGSRVSVNADGPALHTVKRAGTLITDRVADGEKPSAC